MKNQEELFKLIRKIDIRPDYSQRDLADDLGFSLGKLNYLIKLLREKGLIKINNFKKKEDKFNYLKKYILTSKGITFRVSLTLSYMKKKMKEYETLKNEINDLK